MIIEVLTIFPGIFTGLFDYGMVAQARKREQLELSVIDLRQYATDKHRTVDDRPYGGGQGMVLKPEPIFEAVEDLKARRPGNPRICLLSPQGKRFDQNKAKELSLTTRLMLICGRYEGVDQRVADHLADEEISIGDFVLTGGELAAAVIVDSVTRLVPGVLGEGTSALQESFMEGLLDYPQYTRPAEFRGLKVPQVLLSGNHDKIRNWREREALQRTASLRPDLLESRESKKGEA